MVFQPDVNLPEDGSFDALALRENASLADAFNVEFTLLDSLPPGPQTFNIYELDAKGSYLGELGSGTTVPATAIPDPGTLPLAAGGLLICFRRLRKTPAGF